jgi:hypothetical protein
MMYTPPTDDVLASITYGSHLYGTSTPSSDFDFKVVTLPPYRRLILAKPLNVERFKFDADGNPVGDDKSMPPNGYEAEHTPVQKFVHDYLGGQAYAVEVVYAVLQGYHQKHTPPVGTLGSRRAAEFEKLCRTLHNDFRHRNVNGMVGFAMKQTFDYVRRGERLNQAQAVMEEIRKLFILFGANGTVGSSLRLDTPMSSVWAGNESTVLDELLSRTGLGTGTSMNHNKVMRTLELNGRSYLETTGLVHLENAVHKLVDQYGERSTNASKTDVDWKSLSHAVRVYEQVLELLETGYIEFPRKNAADLLKIKSGQRNIEAVKDLLRQLDDQVMAAVATSAVPEVDEEMRRRADEMLYLWLVCQY